MLTYAGVKFDVDGEGDVAVLGFPSDLGADTRAGQGNGPTHLRYHALMPKGIFPYTPYDGLVIDTGDVVVVTRDNDAYLQDVTMNVADVANRCSIVYGLGGDDSVTYGMVAGLTTEYGQIGVLHYDAHTDTDQSDSIGIDHSNWVTHANQFAPFRQWGCRETSSHTPLDDPMEDDLPLLIAIDMDVFDPSFAPGVAVPVPFGPAPFDVLADIEAQIMGHPVAGICITEVCPDRDQDGRTATLACYLVNRILSKL